MSMKKIIGLVILVSFGLLFVGCHVSEDATFDVIYASDGNAHGFAPTDNKHYKIGEEAIVLDQGTMIHKEGYPFKGWNTKPDGTGTLYKPGEKVVINGKVFFYSVWDEGL